MHKLVNEKQPPSFFSLFQKPHNFDSETNRNPYCYTIDLLKNQFMSRLPSATLPRAWNPIDTKDKFIESHKVFKKNYF